MLRSVTLGLALSVLAAACALIEPPVPPGTKAIEVEVRNETLDPLAFGVTTPNRVIPVGAQPTSMGPGRGATAVVTFYVPIEGFYRIVLSPEHSLGKGDAWRLFEPGCKGFVEVEDDGLSHAGCDASR